MLRAIFVAALLFAQGVAGQGTTGTSCPAGTYLLRDGSCVTQCPPGTFPDVDVCVPIPSDGTETFVPSPSPSATVLPSTPLPTPFQTTDFFTNDSSVVGGGGCPTGTVLTTSGTCVRITPPPTPYPTPGFYKNDTSVTGCPTGAYITSNGTCVFPSALPTPFPTRQACPDGMMMTTTGDCIHLTPPPTPAPTRQVCPDGTISTTTGDCIRLTPLPTSAPTRQVCPDGTILTPTGSCVRVTSPPTPFPTPGFFRNDTKPPCPVGFFMTPDGVCKQIPPNFGNDTMSPCPTGFFMTPAGFCVSFDAMCDKEMAGTRFNPETRRCECPFNMWIVRNRTATTRDDFAMCAPIPSSVVTTLPPPRIACASFIPNTVYVKDLDTCLCARDFPVIVPMPDDPMLPFRCAQAGTESPIATCLLPTYFDFLEGRCVFPEFLRNDTNIDIDGTPLPTVRPTPIVAPSKPMTPRPTPLAPSNPMTPRPTRLTNPSAPPTPLPTRIYMRSAYPTPSAPPTDRPTPRPTRNPETTPSSTRTPRPAEAIWADVSRPPLPSVDAKPPRDEIPRLPLPSPWVPRRNITLESWEMPPRIDSTIQLPGADSTAVDRPETIQQVQASLACSLRLPLENVRITNITVVSGTGTRRPIQLDPSAYALTSNGNKECLQILNDTASPVRRRRLQGSSGGDTVVVDYAIVNPPVEIVALTATELTTILTESPTMTTVAANVGSSGVVVTTEGSANNAGGQPSAPPTATDDSSPSVPSWAAAAGGAAAGAAIVIAVVSLVSILRRRGARRVPPPPPPRRTAFPTSPQVHVVYPGNAAHIYMNPVAAQTLRTAPSPSHRMIYEPRTLTSARV